MFNKLVYFDLYMMTCVSIQFYRIKFNLWSNESTQFHRRINVQSSLNLILKENDDSSSSCRAWRGGKTLTFHHWWHPAGSAAWKMDLACNFDASLLHFSEGLHHWRLLNIQRNNFVENELHGHDVRLDLRFFTLNIFAVDSEGKGFIDYWNFRKWRIWKISIDSWWGVTLLCQPSFTCKWGLTIKLHA